LKWPYRWGTALASAKGAGAGRFAFPANPLDRWPLPARSSGCSRVFRPLGVGGRRSRAVSVPREVGPRDLLLSFRALSSLPELLATSEEVRVLPLVGFARLHPSAVRLPTRPLPGACAPFGPTVRPVESCSARVVSHHLDGLLRVGSAGLLRPAAGLWGSSRFPAQSGHLSMIGNLRSVPRDADTPFEEFPSSAAVLHRCSRCLLAVSVRPWRSRMLRSAEADPHIDEEDQGRGGAGPTNRGWEVRTLLPPEFVAPSASPVARLGGQQPSGGAADFQALLR
jgi:hypothetical protein